MSVRRTRRKSLNGFTRFIDTFAQWVPHFTCFGFAFRTDSHPGYRNIFRAFSLVVSDCVPGAGRGADVFRYRGLPPLFRTPLVQDQPGVSIRARVSGDDFWPEGSAVVGGASPAPSPAFGSGTESALPAAVRFFWSHVGWFVSDKYD